MVNSPKLIREASDRPAGIGSMGHIASELMQQMTGITLNGVP